MALVDALETQLATARITAEKLMEAVVAEFTGQRSISDLILKNRPSNFGYPNGLVADSREGAPGE
jgi:hypothetical protein